MLQKVPFQKKEIITYYKIPCQNKETIFLLQKALFRRILKRNGKNKYFLEFDLKNGGIIS